MEYEDALDALTEEISTLRALLCDRHPEAKSWQWLVEHHCITAVHLMEELHLLDGIIEKEE